MEDWELHSLSAGRIVCTREESYIYSGVKDGTHYWFFSIDEDGEPEEEPSTMFTRSQVKRMYLV